MSLGISLIEQKAARSKDLGICTENKALRVRIPWKKNLPMKYLKFFFVFLYCINIILRKQIWAIHLIADF